MITLRAIEPEDLDLLYRIENDVRLWNVGTSNVPYSRYVLHDYVAHVTNDIYTDHQVRLIVENAETAAKTAMPIARTAHNRAIQTALISSLNNRTHKNMVCTDSTNGYM